EDDALPPVLIARTDVGITRSQLGGPEDVVRRRISVVANALGRVDVPVLVLVPARRSDTGDTRDVLVASVARRIGFERSDDLRWVIAARSKGDDVVAVGLGRPIEKIREVRHRIPVPVVRLRGIRTTLGAAPDVL